MYIKESLSGKPALSQLFILILLVLAGTLVASGLSAYIYIFSGITESEMLNHPDLLRWLQLLTAICTFLLPALGLAYLCSDNPRRFLSIGTFPTATTLLHLFILYFLFSPFLSLTQYINELMVLPDFMAPIENWMREQEDLMEEFTRVLTTENSPVTLLFNLLVIAIAAGVTEEFFFRGALQRIFERWNLNPHAVIWIVAILFSAFHMQFYGFIPRMFMGVYFGYLLLWSRNIWVPVFAHFLNNAIAVIGMSNSRIRENEYFSGDFAPDHFLPLCIFALIALILAIPVLKRLKKILQLT